MGRPSAAAVLLRPGVDVLMFDVHMAVPLCHPDTIMLEIQKYMFIYTSRQLVEKKKAICEANFSLIHPDNMFAKLKENVH